MAVFTITKSSDRSLSGNAVLISADGETVLGPVPACTTADEITARNRQNSTAFPLLPYGDTPEGEFEIWSIVPTGDGSPFSETEFGGNGAMVIEAVTGEALKASKIGRRGFIICGGELDDTGSFRPMNGSVRLFDKDIAQLIQKVLELAENDDETRILIQSGEPDTKPVSVAFGIGLDYGDPIPAITAIIDDQELTGSASVGWGETHVRTIHDRHTQHTRTVSRES